MLKKICKNEWEFNLVQERTFQKILNKIAQGLEIYGLEWSCNPEFLAVSVCTWSQIKPLCVFSISSSLRAEQALKWQSSSYKSCKSSSVFYWFFSKKILTWPYNDRGIKVNVFFNIWYKEAVNMLMWPHPHIHYQ